MYLIMAVGLDDLESRRGDPGSFQHQASEESKAREKGGWSEVGGGERKTEGRGLQITQLPMLLQSVWCPTYTHLGIVNNFSLVPYDDENKRKLFQRQTSTNNATLLVCRSDESKTKQKFNRRIFYERKFPNLHVRYM